MVDTEESVVGSSLDPNTSTKAKRRHRRKRVLVYANDFSHRSFLSQSKVAATGYKRKIRDLLQSNKSLAKALERANLKISHLEGLVTTYENQLDSKKSACMMLLELMSKCDNIASTLNEAMPLFAQSLETLGAVPSTEKENHGEWRLLLQDPRLSVVPERSCVNESQIDLSTSHSNNVADCNTEASEENIAAIENNQSVSLSLESNNSGPEVNLPQAIASTSKAFTAKSNIPISVKSTKKLPVSAKDSKQLKGEESTVAQEEISQEKNSSLEKVGAQQSALKITPEQVNTDAKLKTKSHKKPEKSHLKVPKGIPSRVKPEVLVPGDVNPKHSSKKKSTVTKEKGICNDKETFEDKSIKTLEAANIHSDNIIIRRKSSAVPKDSNDSNKVSEEVCPSSEKLSVATTIDKSESRKVLEAAVISQQQDDVSSQRKTSAKDHNDLCKPSKEVCPSSKKLSSGTTTNENESRNVSEPAAVSPTQDRSSQSSNSAKSKDNNDLNNPLGDASSSPEKTSSAQCEWKPKNKRTSKSSNTKEVRVSSHERRLSSKRKVIQMDPTELGMPLTKKQHLVVDESVNVTKESQPVNRAKPNENVEKKERHNCFNAKSSEFSKPTSTREKDVRQKKRNLVNVSDKRRMPEEKQSHVPSEVDKADFDKTSYSQDMELTQIFHADAQLPKIQSSLKSFVPEQPIQSHTTNTLLYKSNSTPELSRKEPVIVHHKPRSGSEYEDYAIKVSEKHRRHKTVDNKREKLKTSKEHAENVGKDCTKDSHDEGRSKKGESSIKRSGEDLIRPLSQDSKSNEGKRDDVLRKNKPDKHGKKTSEKLSERVLTEIQTQVSDTKKNEQDGQPLKHIITEETENASKASFGTEGQLADEPIMRRRRTMMSYKLPSLSVKLRRE